MKAAAGTVLCDKASPLCTFVFTLCKTRKLAVAEEARRVAEAKVEELKNAMATQEKAGVRE